MTLKVVIYGFLYDVKYPSLRRVKDLQREFATMCMEKLKECGQSQFFVYIHCRKDDFSNKMMLNRHQYVSSCSGA